jgi:hypothetical protein
MHPKAALLALHGFGIYCCVFERHIRIKRGERNKESALSVDVVMLRAGTDLWELMTSSMRDEYKPMHWDLVADDVWVQLPQMMIDKFILTCQEN